MLGNKLEKRIEVRFMMLTSKALVLYAVCCTRGALHGVLSAGCRTHGVRGVLYAGCYTQSTVREVLRLHAGCCTRGALHEVLYTGCCTRGAARAGVV